MSGSCARPECQELAGFWYLALPASQVVEVFEREYAHCVGLCETHFLRFSLPTGWELKRPDREPEQQSLLPSSVIIDRDARSDPMPLAEAVVDRVEVKQQPIAEVSQPRQPWFVSGKSSSAGPTESRRTSPINGGSGLLDRAFNGPKPVQPPAELDGGQPVAPVASNGEAPIESTSSGPAIDYEMTELPFPPAAPEYAELG